MQQDGTNWLKTDSEGMGYYQQPHPQRPSPMYHRDSNAYEGGPSGWRAYQSHPHQHHHSQPPSAPYSYSYHHSYPAAPSAYPPAPHPHSYPPQTSIYDACPPAPPHYYHDSSISSRGGSNGGSSPTPSLLYVHPSSSDSSSNLHQQQHLPASDLIYEIRDADVLCGRGAPSQHHPGNQYFRSLVNQYQSSYLAARRIRKPEIATHVVDTVRARGGRFLKRCKVEGVGPCGHFCWQDIGEQRAYEKACQALREGAPGLRRQLAAKEVAAAALTLDSIGRYRSVNDSLVEGRDDGEEAAQGDHATSDKRE